MSNISVAAEFLGAENIEILKKSVIELLIEQIKVDLEDSAEYLISPYQVQEILDEAIDEAKAEIVKDLKNSLKLKLEKTIEESNLFSV